MTHPIDQLIAHQRDQVKHFDQHLEKSVAEGKVTPVYAARKLDIAREILQILVDRAAEVSRG